VGSGISVVTAGF